MNVAFLMLSLRAFYVITRVAIFIIRKKGNDIGKAYCDFIIFFIA